MVCKCLILFWEGENLLFKANEWCEIVHIFFRVHARKKRIFYSPQNIHNWSEFICLFFLLPFFFPEEGFSWTDGRKWGVFTLWSHWVRAFTSRSTHSEYCVFRGVHDASEMFTLDFFFFLSFSVHLGRVARANRSKLTLFVMRDGECEMKGKGGQWAFIYLYIYILGVYETILEWDVQG